MEKIVRVYYSTFIDVPMESENFSSDEEMIEYAENNTEDFLSLQEINDNLAKEKGKSFLLDQSLNFFQKKQGKNLHKSKFLRTFAHVNK